MALDLHPYGLNWVLDPSTMTTKFVPDSPTYAQTTRSGDIISIMIGTQEKKYRITGKNVGSGSYGTTFPVEDLNGDTMPKVVKVLVKSSKFDEQPEYYLREAIVQIVVAKETETESYPQIDLYGPFVPRLYHIGIGEKEYYLVSERLDKTIHEYNIPRYYDREFRIRLAKVAKILEVLYTKVQFNHRDLKLDNIMYKLNANGTENIKLIDFGYSCLKYQGITIFNASTIMFNCFKITRDVSSLLYYIRAYAPISKAGFLYKIIDILLKSQDGAKPATWGNTYSTFNSLGDYANLYPEVIFNIFSNINSTNYNTWLNYLPEINIEIVSISDDAMVLALPPVKLIDAFCENPHKFSYFSEKKLMHLLNYAESHTTSHVDKLVDCIGAIMQKNNPVIDNIIKTNKYNLFEKVLNKYTFPETTIFHILVSLSKKYLISKELQTAAERLTNAPVLINTPNKDGLTPLIYAFAGMDVINSMWFLSFPGLRLTLTDSTALIKAIELLPETIALPIIDKILNLNKTPEFINYTTSNGVSALILAMENKYETVLLKLLELPDINTTLPNTTILIKALELLPGTKLEPVIDKILEQNKTPEFINFIPEGSNVSALRLAIEKKYKTIILKLLSLENINTEFPNSTALAELLSNFPKQLPTMFIDKIPKSQFTPDYISSYKNYAILISTREGNLPVVKYLVEAGASVPLTLIAYVASITDKTMIDYILSIANTPMHINAVLEITSAFKNYSPLMLAVKSRNLYLVSRLLEYPALKTAYINPDDGKTALHYAARESRRVNGNNTRTALSSDPVHQILKLLIDRNPALTEIRNSAKKGPGNPAYVGYGFTRKYIKSRKSGMFGKKHQNTNMTGGKKHQNTIIAGRKKHQNTNTAGHKTRKQRRF